MQIKIIAIAILMGLATLAAALTPPDPLSGLIAAGATVLVYGVGVIVGRTSPGGPFFRSTKCADEECEGERHESVPGGKISWAAVLCVVAVAVTGSLLLFWVIANVLVEWL